MTNGEMINNLHNIALYMFSTPIKDVLPKAKIVDEFQKFELPMKFYILQFILEELNTENPNQEYIMTKGTFRYLFGISNEKALTWTKDNYPRAKEFILKINSYLRPVTQS